MEEYQGQLGEVGLEVVVGCGGILTTTGCSTLADTTQSFSALCFTSYFAGLTNDRFNGRMADFRGYPGDVIKCVVN